jgi:hypothetical protein
MDTLASILISDWQIAEGHTVEVLKNIPAKISTSNLQRQQVHSQ